MLKARTNIYPTIPKHQATQILPHNIVDPDIHHYNLRKYSPGYHKNMPFSNLNNDNSSPDIYLEKRQNSVRSLNNANNNGSRTQIIQKLQNYGQDHSYHHEDPPSPSIINRGRRLNSYVYIKRQSIDLGV